MNIFEAGKGINANKLNENFEEIQDLANDNESVLSTIYNTALQKDGSNLTQTIIDQFNSVTPNILTTSGNISLEDNSVYFITLTGAGTIQLPLVSVDTYSHTIIVIVTGGLYSLNLGTGYHLLQNSDIDTTQPYSIMYVYNKIDSHWYYCITQ